MQGAGGWRSYSRNDTELIFIECLPTGQVWTGTLKTHFPCWSWHFHAKLQTGETNEILAQSAHPAQWELETTELFLIYDPLQSAACSSQVLRTSGAAVPGLITVGCLFVGDNSCVSVCTIWRREVLEKNWLKKLLPVCCLFVFPLILAKLCSNLKTIFTLRTTFFTSFQRKEDTHTTSFVKIHN